MEVPAHEQDADADEPLEEPSALVSSHETRPGRVVFTERDNVDGWIATDAAVDLER